MYRKRVLVSLVVEANKASGQEQTSELGVLRWTLAPPLSEFELLCPSVSSSVKYRTKQQRTQKPIVRIKQNNAWKVITKNYSYITNDDSNITITIINNHYFNNQFNSIT